MKNVLHLVTIISSILLFTSCSHSSDELRVNEEKFYNLLNTEQLTNSTIIKQTNTLFDKNSHKVSMKNSLNESITFDFSNILISDYSNTDVKSLVINQNSYNFSNINYSFVTYLDENNSVMDDYLIICIEELESNMIHTKYYDSNNDLIASMYSKDGTIVSLEGYSVDGSKLKGWWSRWGGCIGDAFKRMSSDTVAGSIEGVACIAFGPSCAAGMTIGCAIKAI